MAGAFTASGAFQLRHQCGVNGPIIMSDPWKMSRDTHDVSAKADQWHSNYVSRLVTRKHHAGQRFPIIDCLFFDTGTVGDSVAADGRNGTELESWRDGSTLALLNDAVEEDSWRSREPCRRPLSEMLPAQLRSNELAGLTCRESRCENERCCCCYMYICCLFIA